MIRNKNWLFISFLVCFYQGVNGSPASSFETSATSLGGRRWKRSITVQGRTHCEDPSDTTYSNTRVNTSSRVASLIEEMKKETIQAYIVPAADEHLSEYISDFDKRRDYISGFKGSAGTAVVLVEGSRALWTDGRYFLQADQEMDCGWSLMKNGIEGVPTLLEWLKASLKPGDIVAADPKLMSAVDWIKYNKGLNESSILLHPLSRNLVDEIWPENERPPKIQEPLQILDLKFSGKKWEDKIDELRETMKKAKVDMAVVTAMDEVAWLFNLRGADVPFTPVFRSYAIIDMKEIRLFLDRPIEPQVDLYLRINQCEGKCVEIFNYNTIIPTLKALASSDSYKKVLIPSKYSYSGGASYAIYSAVSKDKMVLKPSPVLISKAKKNAIETRGMRNAHLKDAVALIDFFSLLDEEVPQGKYWDELTAVKRLEELRAEQTDFSSASFDTISAFGSNGAIIHYRPSNETKKVIDNTSLYLLDSGGQYKDGTTDVTRTVHYGEPTTFQKEMYTRVLKGALNVAMLVIPKGMKDTRVDILARKSLFEVGLNYRHGTGHGIGMFLSVHESPTLMNVDGKEEHAFELGHFFSDEPGYYKDGDFGIRLETILSVVPVKTKYNEIPMFGFLPVTLVPFEPKLIVTELLNKKQCEYVNRYHKQIRDVVGPELEDQNKARAHRYMLQKTEPLDCSMSGIEDGKAFLKIFDDYYSAFEKSPTESVISDKPEKQPSTSHANLLNPSLGFVFITALNLLL